MEEQTQIPAPTTPSIPTVEEPPLKKRSLIQLIVLTILILLLGGWVGFWVNKTVVKIKTKPTPTPTPIQSQIAPSSRKESPIASQSAFLSTSDSIATLSASLFSYTLINTELDPPSIELPLGFSDK